MLTGVDGEYPIGFAEKDITPNGLPVSGFLTKPVDFDMLTEKLRQVLVQKPVSADYGRRNRSRPRSGTGPFFGRLKGFRVKGVARKQGPLPFS